MLRVYCRVSPLISLKLQQNRLTVPTPILGRKPGLEAGAQADSGTCAAGAARCLPGAPLKQLLGNMQVEQLPFAVLLSEKLPA